MSGREHTWGEPDYPKICPECAAGSTYRPPETRRRRLVRLICSAVYLPGMAPLAVTRHGLAGLGPIVLAALAVIPLFLAYRRLGGSRFAERGFVLCPVCGWLRSGRDASPEAARRQARGGYALHALMSLWLLGAVGQFALPFQPGRRRGREARP